MEEKVHLKGLNGLRAIAALAVLFFHLNMSLHLFNLPNLRNIDLAGYGVTIFFSISGFLITYLLLAEKTKTGTIRIGHFYIRRMLRIWPLYYMVMALSIITGLAFGLDMRWGSILYYLFFLANVPFILNTGMPFLGPYWSLGVEEQFYIFWPWLVKHCRRILTFTFIFTICFLAARVFCRFLEYKYGYSLPYAAIHVTRFDCMTIGAMGAILIHQKNQLFLKITTHTLTQLVAWTVIALLAFNLYHVASVIDNEIVSTITVILIVNLSFNPKTIIGMENFFFDFLGKVSYGIYMFHLLVIFYLALFINNIEMSLTARYLVIYTSVPLITILVAWLSYSFFEKPFLKIKTRYSTIPNMATAKQ